MLCCSTRIKILYYDRALLIELYNSSIGCTFLCLVLFLTKKNKKRKKHGRNCLSPLRVAVAPVDLLEQRVQFLGRDRRERETERHKRKQASKQGRKRGVEGIERAITVSTSTSTSTNIYHNTSACCCEVAHQRQLRVCVYYQLLYVLRSCHLSFIPWTLFIFRAC